MVEKQILFLLRESALATQDGKLCSAQSSRRLKWKEVRIPQADSEMKTAGQQLTEDSLQRTPVKELRRPDYTRESHARL